MQNIASTYAVAAAVNVQLGRHGDGGTEPEEGVQGVKDDHQEWVALKGLLNSGWNEIEKRQHREDCAEHVVVDDGRVPGECGCDDVSDQCHDKESPDEL